MQRRRRGLRSAPPSFFATRRGMDPRVCAPLRVAPPVDDEVPAPRPISKVAIPPMHRRRYLLDVYGSAHRVAPVRPPRRLEGIAVALAEQALAGAAVRLAEFQHHLARAAF